MSRTILLAGVIPFISAFLGGVLAIDLMVAPPATAQSNETQEVRAAAFTLVGPDGTVLARLAPGPNGGGNLALRDAAGTQRLVVGGRGLVIVYDQDGVTPVFVAGRAFDVGAGGGAPINGVLLGPDGAIGILPTAP
jgi:hypothetical protein